VYLNRARFRDRRSGNAAARDGAFWKNCGCKNGRSPDALPPLGTMADRSINSQPDRPSKPALLLREKSSWRAELGWPEVNRPYLSGLVLELEELDEPSG